MIDLISYLEKVIKSIFIKIDNWFLFIRITIKYLCLFLICLLFENNLKQQLLLQVYLLIIEDSNNSTMEYKTYHKRYCRPFYNIKRL